MNDETDLVMLLGGYRCLGTAAEGPWAESGGCGLVHLGKGRRVDSRHQADQRWESSLAAPTASPCARGLYPSLLLVAPHLILMIAQQGEGGLDFRVSRQSE